MVETKAKHVKQAQLCERKPTPTLFDGQLILKDYRRAQVLGKLLELLVIVFQLTSLFSIPILTQEHSGYDLSAFCECVIVQLSTKF